MSMCHVVVLLLPVRDSARRSVLPLLAPGDAEQAEEHARRSRAVDDDEPS